MFHILGGAIVGAVVGAVASAATDLVRGKPISWKKVGAAAVGGAAAGAITAATFGAGGAVAATATAKITGLVGAGAAAGATEQVTDNLLHDKPWHEDVARNTAVGAAAGGGLGVGGRALAPLARHGGRWLGTLSSRGGQALRHLRGQAGRVPGALAAGRQRGADLARGVWVASRDGVRRGLGATRRVWDRYLHLLDKYPVRTKSLTSGVIMGGGDLIAQGIEGKPWDWKRTAFMTAFGTLWVGPTGHAWYGALSRFIPGKTVMAVAGRVAADQIVMAPFGTAVFFAATGSLKAESPGDVWANVKKNFWPALKANYMVWPGVQAVNFGLVPQRLQVGFGNVVALGWTAYLSMVANKDSAEGEPAADDGLDGAPVLPGDLSLGEADDAVAGGVPELATADASPSPQGEGVVESLKQIR
jgi:hypothetical protein